jgi:integrase
MSVHLRSSRYIIDTFWPDGMRTRSKMPDEDTAARINKKIEVAIVDEERIWRKLRRELRLEAGQVTGFSELADRYLEQYVKSYNRDVRVKKSRLDVLKRFFSTSQVDRLTPASVGNFIASKRREGAKNATVNRYLALLRHMMNWSIGQGIIETNPITGIAKLKEVEWVGSRPDEDVIEGILKKFDARILPIFVFLRETGCRRGEAIGLKLSQVDFARAVVTFHGETKSGKSRQVPLTNQALWSVQALPVQAATVFYHPTNLKTFTGDGLGWFWDKTRGESQLRIYDLRHAFAIKLAEDGCPMHFISEVLGHHSVDFTRKRYARFSPESASKSVLRVLQGRKADGTALAQNWHRG